jgi:uncharacterized protein YfiM (DUF2279 family)
LARALAYALLLLLAIGLSLALLLLESQPLLDPARPLTVQEVARARNVLDFGIRSARRGDVTNVVDLQSEELDATANYLLKQLVTGVGHFRLEDGRLAIRATIQPSALPWAYVNLSLNAAVENGRMMLQGARLGDANIPAAWLPAGLALAQRFSALARLAGVLEQAVKDIDVEPGRLRLVYRWDEASLRTMRDLILDITGKRRLRHYHAKLAALVNRPEQGRRMALGELLQPLFALAQQRSQTRDPIEENRALLLVLSAYLSGQKNAAILAGHYSTASTQQRTVLLNHRLDLAKHFTISAALAATANSVFADLAGLAKEIDDSHGGSGFNFQDLAADLAGQRFGHLAVASEQSARLLQQSLSQDAADAAIMPNVRDLPENLDAAAFAERYQAVGSPAFRAVAQDIARRLDGMALYQPQQP